MTDTIEAADYAALAKKPKYGNKKIEEDGYTFDSLAEHRRYRELKFLEAAGEIRALDVHPSWSLFVNGYYLGRYVADFDYVSNGRHIVEDVKSAPTRTPLYRLKKKLMKACYGIDIVEIDA